MKFNNGFYNPFHYITNIKKHVANKHDVAINQYKTQKKVVDEIVLVLNFINNEWLPCYIIARSFETPNTLIRTTLVGQVNFLLVDYGFTNNITAYVNNEGINLNTFSFVLTRVISYAPL
jgi:hypothetical protein